MGNGVITTKLSSIPKQQILHNLSNNNKEKEKIIYILKKLKKYKNALPEHSFDYIVEYLTKIEYINNYDIKQIIDIKPISIFDISTYNSDSECIHYGIIFNKITHLLLEITKNTNNQYFIIMVKQILYNYILLQPTHVSVDVLKNVMKKLNKSIKEKQYKEQIIY